MKAKHLHTVTPFSKGLAMVLFVTLPFLAFLLGIKYQDEISPSGENEHATERVIKVKADDPMDRIERCGLVPTNLVKLEKGQVLMVNGPDWAQDCRHIAWSIKDTSTTSSVNNGLYVYDDKTKQSQKVIAAKATDSPTFQTWKDGNTISYVNAQGPQTYYIVAPTPTPSTSSVMKKY